MGLVKTAFVSIEALQRWVKNFATPVQGFTRQTAGDLFTEHKNLGRVLFVIDSNRLSFAPEPGAVYEFSNAICSDQTVYSVKIDHAARVCMGLKYFVTSFNRAANEAEKPPIIVIGYWASNSSTSSDIWANDFETPEAAATKMARMVHKNFREGTDWEFTIIINGWVVKSDEMAVMAPPDLVHKSVDLMKLYRSKLKALVEEEEARKEARKEESARLSKIAEEEEERAEYERLKQKFEPEGTSQ